MIELRYGTDEPLRLELADESLLAVCETPRGQALADVAAATTQALDDPLGFPPLRQSVVPGDNVVLALEQGVPGAEQVIRATVLALLDAGLSPEDITLVEPPAAPARTAPGQTSPCHALAALPAEIRERISHVVHEPEIREQLSYLGASKSGNAIYIGRPLHDADLVILIGRMRVTNSLAYFGVPSSLYPGFSDTASQDRYRALKALNSAEQARLKKQADEVSWMLGLQFTIQVVPGGNGQVLHVLAGDPTAVGEAGSRLCDEAWRSEVPSRAALVVATIDGGPDQQTWENVGRALAAAARVTSEDEAAVLVCSQLAEKLSPSLQRLAGAEDLEEVLSEMGQATTFDTLTAAELIAALERGQVYLVSQLDDELVESLGVLPVGARSVSKAAARYPSCIVLTNAHEAQAQLPEEAVTPGGRKAR